MADRLYYSDGYIQSFTTELVKQQKDETGNLYVVLAQTAFYPTGGGQPHDIGTLNDVPVINVDEADEEIRHYIEKPLEIIDEVFGVINWERRFDHMQQHLGQHILSACFEELFNISTVSFHLGTEFVTIDLDIDQLTEEQVIEVETLANQVILENRPVETKWVTESELSQYPLRKAPSVQGGIRLVIIPELDYNGCGGTHPNTTGEVRAIQILNWERQKKKIRVQFVCGERVLKQFRAKHKVVSHLTQLLSTPEQEMVSAVNRLLEQEKDLQKTLEETREQLLKYEVRELLEKANLQEGFFILTSVFQDRTIQELQKLVRLLTTERNDLNVFLVAENEDKLQFVFGRGATSEVSMNSIIRQALPLVNGRGGGNEVLAQGGGEAIITGQQLLNKVVKLL
ncbi:alanyl-tRNA editing protein [Alkalihalobacterium elongatum]|uniref:alanyl-tRNA editing protein n=1 Tax=Alkalihalobacterium elongatum TaxID=2675466 RepID=UPI001C1F8A9B|nr:DHHA1 domain-containing protein [Alkalihalobacterium elongatum]